MEFKVLAHLTTLRRFLSVNAKTSKKSMVDRVISPRWAMFFFEVLPFTDKNDAATLGVSRPLITGKHDRSGQNGQK